MAHAVKTNTEVRAWVLGEGSDAEKEMIRQGRMIAHADGTYELFTQEAPRGKGETADRGDFFKIDNKGYPYPTSRAYFLSNHTHIEGDRYEQTARPLLIWRYGEEETEEIRYLLDRDILHIDPDDPAHLFRAFLWGTEETAPSDAVVIFYSVDRDPEGKITDINFNFVVKDYFEKYYRILDE